MPDPNSKPGPASELVRHAEETGTKGWEPASEASASITESTITRVAESTPGPARAEEQTRTGDTERVAPPDLGDPNRLPVVPGYRVEERIGRGGMATVYRAVHLEMNRTVALKLINPGGRDSDYVHDRFEREVQTLAKVDHPNVVTVYNSGEWSGFPFLTMKYVAGGPLSANLARFRDDPRAAARLVAKIACGVQALHAAKVLHRDLKPHNILLADGDEPLVADFGLAKWVDEPDSELTVTHIPLGTRQYMSPEQTLGLKSQYAAPCDVWAIGIILHELLSGKRPFSDADTSELFERIRTAEPEPLPADVSAALGAIVQKCLAKKPEDRYQSAAAIAAHLESWLAGDFVVPPPPAPPPMPAMPTWAFAIGVLALLALIFLPPSLMSFGSTHDASAVDKPLTPAPSVHVVVKKSIGELLMAGETVVLVDENGRLLVEFVLLPGSEGLPTAEFKGFLTLNSSGRLAIELARVNPLMPVRFQGEAAFLRSNSDTSWKGILAGALETPSPSGVNISTFEVNQRNNFIGGAGGNQVLREKGSFEIRRIPVVGQSGNTEMGSAPLETPLLADREPELLWRKFEFTIFPEQELWNMPIIPARISGFWHNKALGELTSYYSVKTLNFCYQSTNPGSTPIFSLPIVGPVFGLSVNNASAVFKNVKLVPLRP